jgi:hypothetical protein
MTPGTRHTLCSVAIALVGLASAGSTCADQKFTYDYSSPPASSQYVHDYAIDVDDTPGHKIRIVEVLRKYEKDPPELLGIKVTETWFRGFTDYPGSQGGPGHGYQTWLLEDGSRVYLEDQFVSYTEVTSSGSKRGTSHATSRFVGGTGKFAKIRGSLKSTTEFDTDPKNGYNRPISRGEYWIAK